MSEYLDRKEALIAAFPYSLSRDDSKEKLAEVIAEELVRAVAQTENASVFPRVDELPEEVLDILAYDLKIDWYEPEAPIWNKRLAVKECILVHKYKGTKYAVETALHSMYKSAEVQEWFQYGGEPFHFQIRVYGSSGDKLSTLYLKIQYAKNLRSVMDSIRFVLVPDGEFEITFGHKLAAIYKRVGSRLEYPDDSIYTSRSEIFANFSRSGAFKRLFSSLCFGVEIPPRAISGTYTAGLKSQCFVKKIRMEVKL